MCGIVGVVNRDPSRPVTPDLVRALCGAIRHRGPDDEGVHVQGAVGLGMRRLSIIDLGGGHQPIYNEDRSAVIVYNGEVYNYAELRRELVARGHVFATHSDTETILHLYEEMGPRCVERLRGMFAFAIWDERKRTLLLARDRFGMKPLYVALTPGRIAFASELKALVEAGITTRSLDWDAVDMYLQLGYIPAPATPFADVRKLEPGHVLVWREGEEPRTERYWSLPTDDADAPDDVEEQLVEWLDESVRAHMVSDVPVAAFLSGGFDSSAVVAGMAQAGVTPHAFTARYRGSGAAAADETALARLLADRYGAKLSVVDVAPDAARILGPVVRALDEPHADESAIPTWILSEAVAREYKVVLAGTGGDELFAGYRRHLGLLAGQWYARVPGPLRRAASRMADLVPEPRGGDLHVHRAKRFLRSAGDDAARYLGYLSRTTDALRGALYGDAMRAAAGGAALARLSRIQAEAGGNGAGVRAALRMDYGVYLPDDLLALSDRIAMAHSLEVRVPFVDHVLIERVFPLSDRVRIGFWRPKRLLKAALRGRLPQAHYTAPKRGFVGPMAAWLRHELREVLADELSARRLATLGYFRPETVERLQREHASGRQNHAAILWALLCFSLWHREYVEAAPRPLRAVA